MALTIRTLGGGLSTETSNLTMKRCGRREKASIKASTLKDTKTVFLHASTTGHIMAFNNIQLQSALLWDCFLCWDRWKCTVDAHT